jgi:hypothetical protein
MTTDFFEGNEINRWSVNFLVRALSGQKPNCRIVTEAYSLPSRANQACIW